MKDRIFFIKQLHNLVSADVPLLKALQLIRGQIKGPFYKILDSVTLAVADGFSLSAALSVYPELFPLYLTSMIQAGEMSGNLIEVLCRLDKLLEDEEETKGKIRTALIYPGILLSVGVLTVFILLTFVIPKLAGMLQETGQSLPVATQILIDVSWFLSRCWWVLVVATIFAASWVRNLYRRPEDKLRIDTWLLTIPLCGKFIKTQNLERFARTLGILLASGVEMASALECVQDVVDNEFIRVQIRNISQDVVRGASLTTAMERQSVFPVDVTGIVAVGEEAGRLDVVLLKLSESLSEEIKRMARTATTLVEPVLILAIGSVVGFIVLALLLPIFEMNFVSS